MKQRNTAELINTLHPPCPCMLNITRYFYEYITSSKPLFHVHVPTRTSVPYNRAKATLGECYCSIFRQERKNLRGEERENAGSWIIEQITFVWVQGEGETTRERDSPPILLCPVWYVGSHRGERFMANWSSSNISRKATSGSIATILAGHINPLLYVVLSVQ